MNIYNSPVTKIAFWVIVIGGAACLLIPLFAPLLGNCQGICRPV